MRITKRSEDFSAWYTDVIRAADLAEHGPARGSMVIKPYGYAIWERIQKTLDDMLKMIGVENAYFPLLIPEGILKRESEHFDGFFDELVVATHGGGRALEEPLVIRPTSEAIVWSSFSRWIRSARDLPMLINQWASVVRWENRSDLFLRTAEFLWQEGHTAHASAEEAREYALMILHDIYRKIAEEYLAIPVYEGRKSHEERFAGAEETYCIEAMMQDGKSLQAGTSHYLADHFSKAFNVSCLDRGGEFRNVFQTSWGVSTRLIGGLIMSHGDDDGLVLPPKVAPIQIVLMSATDATNLDGLATTRRALSKYRSKIDGESELNLEERRRFWERKGVPVRIEIGLKDAREQCCLTRRDTGEAVMVSLDNVEEVVAGLLDGIQESLFLRAYEQRQRRNRLVEQWADFAAAIESGGYTFAHWCEENGCQRDVKKKTGAITRFQPFESNPDDGKGQCVNCGRASPSKRRWVFARAY